VQVLSKVGEGTQAVLTIPNRYRIAAPVRSDAATPSQAPAAHAHDARIILVEDNDGVRLATELFLKLEGYETHSAATLAGAESLLELVKPGDVVIADYHLDGANTGLDLLLKLRERVGYEVPGIIMSGDLPSVLRSIRTPVSACRFLSKPVDTAALIDAIVALGASGNQDSGAAQVTGSQPFERNIRRG
jgi:DNA-binding NtrC family response regulator